MSRSALARASRTAFTTPLFCSRTPRTPSTELPCASGPRADEKRAETIRDLRKRTEPDYYDTPDETYWIPYCLSFLSRYPLYNLLGDYLRGMWIHWNKATNLFHAEEVSRILSFPAPQAQ